ncbi:hypothetical protein DPMN_192044 [Dreissena polymorpha]|uniref:B box-type domain-containing protein n=1 Tax=Dreissena polymorpha TaxID=45954 RepID=A0A9D3Y0C4_DREPO|nr:hypothetical protein DPMN_192044 [Dreissena polymorpha]
MNSKHLRNRKNIPVKCTICEHELLLDICYCQQCRQTLCISCVELHDKFSLLKDHKIYKVCKNEEYKRQVNVETTTVEELLECTGSDEDFNAYDYAYVMIKRYDKPHSDLPACKQEVVVKKTFPQSCDKCIGKSSDECIGNSSDECISKSSDECIGNDDDNSLKSGRNENERQTGGNGEPSEASIRGKNQTRNESQTEPPLVPPRVKNFHVTVQNTPLAVKINVVGKRVLAVRTERMFIEDADSKVSIVSIPFKLIRKFSNQAADVLSIDVGRKFEYGEGTIDFESTEATKIFNLMESYLRKKP